MTFELQRDKRDDGSPTLQVVVSAAENPYNNYNKGRVILGITSIAGITHDVALNEREVDDLIVALEYYKSLAREN